MLLGAFGVLEMCDMQIPTNDCEIAVLKTDFDNIIKMLKGACENLRYSPVSCLLGYLIDYFEGKDSAKKFCDSVFMDTRRGQYYFLACLSRKYEQICVCLAESSRWQTKLMMRLRRFLRRICPRMLM